MQSALEYNCKACSGVHKEEGVQAPTFAEGKSQKFWEIKKKFRGKEEKRGEYYF